MLSRRTSKTSCSMAASAKARTRPRVHWNVPKKTTKKDGKHKLGEVKTIANFPDCVINGLETLWRQNLMCDVTIVVEGRRFAAHKILLCSCSDYFYEIFADKGLGPANDHAFVPNLTAPIMETILECMYTGKIYLTVDNVKDILMATDYLRFYMVHDACGEFLIKMLDKEKCFELLNLSFTYSLASLQHKVLAIAAENFKELSRKTAFLNLRIDQLTALLRRDDLKADGEIEVFHRALAWIEKDRRSRECHSPEVLSTVRLPLLNPAVIVDHVESITYLMVIPECQQLVKEALHYHCMPARQSVLQSSRTVPRVPVYRDSLVAVGGAPRMKSDVISDVVYTYDVEKETWKVLTNLVEPRHHHAVAVLGGFMYVAGGGLTNDVFTPLNSVHRYDPRTDTWIHVASMIHCRESFQMSVLNGMIYAVGGRGDKDESISSAERYDPTVNSWEEVASISTPRRGVAVATLNGKIYAVGGSGKKLISSKVEQYNPSTNKWEKRHPINCPRCFAHVVPIGGQLFLLGGVTVDTRADIICIDAIERYTPATDRWCTVQTSMKVSRAESGCIAVKEKIYLLGGYNWNSNERLKSVECYDTASGSWSKLEGLSVPLTGMSCCALAVYELDLTKRKVKDA